MIGLQSFAFLVLAEENEQLVRLGKPSVAHTLTESILALTGLTQAYSYRDDAPVYVEENSFPYYHIPPDLKNDDLYTSAIVSLLSGPLCSGFHISQTVVVTVGSCVFRETAPSLIVVSHNLSSRNGIGPGLFFLPVKKISISSNYSIKTQEHDLAVLEVKSYGTVPVLRLPPLGSAPTPVRNSNMFIAKFSFDEKLDKFFTSFYPVEANMNVMQCSNQSYGFNSFLCVTRTNQQPYSYGLRDLGTPLIYRNPQGDVVDGIFTGHTFNVPKVSYLYHNLQASLAFLYMHTGG